MASEGFREKRKLAQKAEIIVKFETKERYNNIRQILKKEPSLRNEEELHLIASSRDIVQEIEKRVQRQELVKRRVEEVLDPPDLLEEKVSFLVEAILKAKCLVIYTGAGVSTAASIPDYRGPDGVWTRLSRGEKLGSYNLADANPTLTHMSITKLFQEGLVKHVVSQNCDGLHIRSGLPPQALSEVHGNMFVEVCTECEENDEIYYRLFDVTENTCLRRHLTNRFCHKCGGQLRDSIVHFGEKGNLRWPLNWEGALETAKKADCILCLGSSLKVLKTYRALWGMNRVKTRRPNLFIVNLQWTPKDDLAVLKISGRCDDVMKSVMHKLGLVIPEYNRCKDPLFTLATPLRPQELDSFSTKYLNTSETQDVVDKPCNNECDDVKDRKCGINEERIDCSVSLQSLERPGWFGKGYSKNKKSLRKKRRVR
ncbi:NAD-dependent protein deacetylase sirtuin-7-like [Acropora muricata]|uniref:NAD-dependent protein deacetylase sirtuin-7-like n=1 Tax=Acropora muricata TaxID=159855 RepID=UPI0034E493EF